MATTIRPELSEKNKYWIDKHRYYELKHFCLQYPMWKKAYSVLDNVSFKSVDLEGLFIKNSFPGDPTAKIAIAKTYYAERIDMIDDTAKKADIEIHDYILRGVTEGLSFNYLKTNLDIPCGKDMYYDRYRRFFWLLNIVRK